MPNKLIKKEDRNPSKKEDRNPSKTRISKSMEKAFKSGCMCFFDAGKEAEFAARLKKQKEEDAKAGYVEDDAAENDVDISDEEDDSSNAVSSSSKST